MSKSFAPKGSIYVLWVAPVVLLVGASLLLLPTPHAGAPGAVASAPRLIPANPAAHTRFSANYATLPLAFEKNEGQSDSQVKYLARGNGYTFFLTAKDAVFSIRPPRRNAAASSRMTNNRAALSPPEQPAAIRMALVGASIPARITAGDPLPGKSNYFQGSDSRKWHSDVGHYARVSYEKVYPGIDVAFYGDHRQLEFDFLVAPNANPAPIGFGFTGARAIQIAHSGDLIVSSHTGDVVLHKPVAYQRLNGNREPVESSFVLTAKNRVRVALGNYDRSRELIIDPSVKYEYSTYLGGTAADAGEAIAVDGSGNAYIAGDTSSTNFPTTSGAKSTTYGGATDVFVTKISADGSSLIYSTYVGGSGLDGANGIAVDASGNAFVDGTTESVNDFPTTPGAFQTSLKGAANAFVFKLNSTGSALAYSTYLGGTGNDIARAIALDASGNAYTVGTTISIDFPILNALQTTPAGSFVTKMNSTGTALMYSTYLGGGFSDSAFSVAVDSSNNAYVTGKTITASFPTTTGAFQTKCGSDGACNGLADAFVSVINANGNGFVYSTFLGGSLNDYGNGIAVDALGNAYVTGQTSSNTDFPLAAPLQGTFGTGPADAFVTKLNPTGSALVYSTFLGGNQNDIGASIALDADNNAYVTGQTNSSDFPTVGATQLGIGGGYDAFVSEINGAGSQLAISTFIGGSQDEDNLGNFGAIAVDPSGASIYVTGNTASTNFPTHLPLQSNNGGGGLTDAFAVKYAQTTFSITATTPAPVSPGSSGTSTVTLTAYNGYNSSVDLTCSVSGTGSPAPACSASSFSRTPVTPTASGVMTTLTITTTGPMAAASRLFRFTYAMWLPIAGLSLIGVGFSSSVTGRKRLLGFLMVTLIVSSLVLLPACGSVSGQKKPPVGGTPPGNYVVTITGTGADGTVQSTQTTLTVN